MLPMIVQESPRRSPSLLVAIVVSLVLHGLVLFVERQKPEHASQPPGRFDAVLRPRAAAPPPPSVASVEVQPEVKAKPKATPKSVPKKKVLAVNKSKNPSTNTAKPKWTVAQKQEMDKFLKELTPKGAAVPDLKQRSIAMAREFGREQAAVDSQGGETLERIPNSPPVDLFSLELYLDSMVKKMNQSARFVQNDPRARGIRRALVEVKINPNGSLQRFKVVNAADQQIEIEFIKSVVERAIPFAQFPPDMRRSAKSLTMMICIQPPSMSGGFGFLRTPDGAQC